MTSRRDRRRSLVTTLLLSLIAVTLMAFPASAAEPHLEGIDVSHWQGRPNWGQVKAAGIRFVIAKATQGVDEVDAQYARNRSRLRADRIPFTAYHHAQPDLTPGDARAEADHFVNTARLDGNNLLPVLDLKRHNDLSTDALTNWVRDWLERVEERLGVKPIIYTKTAYWTQRMADTSWFADNGYRLWLRDLDVESPTLPAGNWGGHGWTLWQYAVRCCVDGISGKVDRNVYRGDSLVPLRIKNNR